MHGGDLKAILTDLRLTQADFARLIEVTPRAVALWMADERQIPGPAEAYLRLFRLLPPNLRQIELNRLKEKGTSMRDGIQDHLPRPDRKSTGRWRRSTHLREWSSLRIGHRSRAV
jgi:hypothetical protein